jgi:hypothetical protein
VARVARPRGLGLSLKDEAGKRASLRDNDPHWERTALGDRSGASFFQEVRAYLFKQNRSMAVANNVYELLRFKAGGKGTVDIALGPQTDKGDSLTHFHFDSGSRLSFGIILAESVECLKLITYRFHFHLPEGAPIAYLRFDLNDAHSDALSEPRCHVHPGLDSVRLPMSPLTPLEILDLIFFVIEPAL